MAKKAGKMIVIAGHSYHSPGALAYDGLYEHHYTLDLQHRIRLMDNTIVMDCEWNSLTRVIRWVNGIAHLHSHLIDIHFNNNNPNASGTEVFVHPHTSRENKLRADRIAQQISKTLDIPLRRWSPGRDHKYPSESARGRLGIIERTKLPAILVEVCFLNSSDMQKYKGKETEVAKILMQ